MRSKLSPAARRDITQISDYYSDLSESLAARFLEEIRTALKQLHAQPELGSPRFSHVLPGRFLRTWQLDRFPFLVLYSLELRYIDILRILHERRDIFAAFGNE